MSYSKKQKKGTTYEYCSDKKGNPLAKRVRFGANNNTFLEVSKKVAHTDNGDRTFIQVSRGFYADNVEGGIIWKGGISIPDDDEVKKHVVKMLADL
jgi:hypothetical protein